MVLGGQNQNFTEVVLYISALTGCSVLDLKNVLRNVLRITYIYLYPPPFTPSGWVVLGLLSRNRSTKFDVLSACDRNGVQKMSIKLHIMTGHFLTHECEPKVE